MSISDFEELERSFERTIALIRHRIARFQETLLSGGMPYPGLLLEFATQIGPSQGLPAKPRTTARDYNF
jgi:hypothetical protein